MPNIEKKKTVGQKRVDTAIIVAIIGLVGTLAVGILNSPLIIKLLDRSSVTPAKTNLPVNGGRIIFSEDFENNVASGFTFETGKWEIIKENSNFVLKGIATDPIAPVANAYFGPNDFSDGTIEFRVKFLQLYGMDIDFRTQDNGETYVLALSPDYQTIILATNTLENGDWLFSQNSKLPFTFKQNIWYYIQFEIQGDQMALNIDDNRILSISDSRFQMGRIRFARVPGAVIELDDVKVWSTIP
jgi:hypothetical protein